MPPKIMFRIFFSHTQQAQNDNHAGDRSAERGEARSENPAPTFFGSRLAHAVPAHIVPGRAVARRDAESSRSSAGAAIPRRRLMVIDGGVVESVIAEGGMITTAAMAVPRRPAEEENRI
jgi:hypothetical protein